MPTDVKFRHARLLPALVALALACLAAPFARAQDEKLPPFHEFNGVSIGMATDAARQKLGNPADKSDAQDLYSINDKQNALVYYDGGKVSAIVLMFTGGEAPTPKSIFGADVEAKPDGSISKMVRYEKAGYFVAYNRTAGDSPLVTVTIQKIR